jgi:Na+-transporting methylmalonyl-CoA/oxaloacetate decarboxylase gamma subunit
MQYSLLLAHTKNSGISFVFIFELLLIHVSISCPHYMKECLMLMCLLSCAHRGLKVLSNEDRWRNFYLTRSATIRQLTEVLQKLITKLWTAVVILLLLLRCKGQVINRVETRERNEGAEQKIKHRKRWRNECTKGIVLLQISMIFSTIYFITLVIQLPSWYQNSRIHYSDNILIYLRGLQWFQHEK